MTRLPTYADNAIGRALISEIMAAPPESRLIRDDWGTRDYARYSGKPAALLRRLRSEWVDRELATLDRQFAVTHFWDEEASRAVLGTEESDALIQRLLGESAAQRRAA
jgi:hypothetical protein